jgi:nucleoside-diphosphate-sugar epimerase
MRVVVVGASGNVGSAVVRALSDEPQVASVVGVARRQPDWLPPKTQWMTADLARDDLVSAVRGADVVIHLAWQFQPTHDPYVTWQTNVIGTARLLDALDRAGVPALVYASSVGAYSPATDDQPADESWPTHGWPMAAYGREKAYVERLIEAHIAEHPDRRVVLLRPAFIFQAEAASQQRRLFAGPLLPRRLIRPALVPVVPWPRGLRFQALHADDAADAYRRAVIGSVRGPFNIAAEQIVTGQQVAQLLNARLVELPADVVRASMWGAWHAHLIPASPDLFDLARQLPIMSTQRAQTELKWSPQHSGPDAVGAFLHGLSHRAGGPTPPLAA